MARRRTPARFIAINVLLALVCVAGVPVRAWGQAAIAGCVTDASGAFLPGVTVEAASPALIEKVRSVVTDEAGRYAIVDLRPGTFSVTFTLHGFNAVRRERIELTGSFVATVNAQLTIGRVVETINVRPDTPSIDVLSTRQQASMTSEMVSRIPTGRSLVNLGVLIPGMNPWSPRSQTDVGGTNNLQNMFMAIHGGRIADQRIYVDGVAIRNIQSEGYNPNFTPDMSSAEEVTIDYAAGTAEHTTGGVRANYVPRAGGNSVQMSLFATGASSAFQGSNLTPSLRARGLTQPDALKITYDVNPTGGGPIVKDKMWFYGAARVQSNQNYVGGIFENRNAGNPNAWTYDPDFSRLGLFSITQKSANTRLTWQLNSRNTLTAFFERQSRIWDEGNANRSPEAFSRFRFPQNQIAIVRWSSPLSSRLMVDARAAYHAEVWRNIGADEIIPNNRSLIPVVEQGGAYPGLMYRALNGPYAQQSMPFIKVAQSSLSYVTGSQTFKVGFDLLSGTDTNENTFNDSGLQYRFNNGVPNQITEFATPYALAWRLAEFGLFAQHRWTLRRLTLNGGLRFDYFGTAFPQAHLGPGPLVPTRDMTFPETAWYRLKDVSPRLGAAYDLFGDGRTAVSASASRYVVSLTAARGSPVTNLPLSATRSWKDANSNFVPDCAILNPLENGECGTVSDLSFGGPAPSTTFDPAILAGWNVRPVDWEFSAGIQHELRPRVAVNAAYFRRVYGNFTVQDNLAVTAGDYTSFSVTAPIDSRLPAGGGYLVAGLYDLNPNRRGQVNNYVTAADQYGRQIEHWNGVDVGVTMRLPGVLVRGGVSTGRTTTDLCDIAAKVPEVLGTGGALGTHQTGSSLDQCHVDTKFLTQTKWMASYTVPQIGVELAGTFQSTPGPEIQANYVAPNSAVEPSLRRPLSGDAANTTVTLLKSGTLYGNRLTQLDVRVVKVLRFGKRRTALNFDLYNALNASAVTGLNVNYSGSGTGWLQPQGILPARLFKLSAQFDY
jgi:Carboxypeptidase regulatory-like domain